MKKAKQFRTASLFVYKIQMSDCSLKIISENAQFFDAILELLSIVLTYILIYN